ncbi:MAG TPA: hypothetical protein VEG60_31755 [Candidatus Binatia bacterium]|nr:hypothetical protein [Candidatus Binatia bacterium]
MRIATTAGNSNRPRLGVPMTIRSAQNTSSLDAMEISKAKTPTSRIFIFFAFIAFRWRRAYRRPNEIVKAELSRLSTDEQSDVDSNFSNVAQNHFKKIYRAKHVLSNAEGTPRGKEKLSTYFSELGVLCVFARVIFFRFDNSKTNQISSTLG